MGLIRLREDTFRHHLCGEGVVAMNEEITRLDSPIDVMCLIHRAMAAYAATVEREATRIEVRGSLQPFRSAFNEWASALLHLSEVEVELLTTSLRRCLPGGELGEQIERQMRAVAPSGTDEEGQAEQQVMKTMAAYSEEEHRELVEKLQDVLEVLDGEIGRQSVIDRTRQHLYVRVLALRVAQDDHIENERAFVLPLLRRAIGEPEQLDMARRLLIDEGSESPDWILQWVARKLGPGERGVLADLEARIRKPPLSAA